MRIAIITSPFGPLPPNALGAVEKRWYYIGINISTKGHIVTFYSKNDLNYNFISNVEIVPIEGYQRTKSVYLDILKDFFYTIKSLFRLKSCDILVQNTFWAPILSPLVWWKYKKSIYNVARMPKGQFLLYKSVSQFSCVTMAVKKALEKELGTSSRIVVVGNPLNIEDFKFLIRNSNPEEFVISYHGRIHKEKGLDLLCSAVQILSSNTKIRLKLIGPYEREKGGSGTEYVNKLKKLCPDVNVTFLGGIYSPQKLNDQLLQSDIYCYPSIADQGETFGVSPLEAMGTGLPVVVSALECFNDFIENEITGLVFDHHADNAVELLAAQIYRLIENPKLRSRLGDAGYKKSQEFSVDNIANKYLRNFECLLSD